MDPLFIGGLVLALLAVVAATLIDGNSFGALVGPSSLVLVIFGSLGATLMSTRISELAALPKAAILALTGGGPPDPDPTVTQLAGLAEVIRREGMLALEAKMAEVDDPFLQRGVQLLVDGQDAEQIAEVLQIDISALDERHQRNIGFFKTLGGYAPTVGMLGTVIGLVNMLGNLSDPAQLGIGMALALLTTLYGVTFANLVFLPFATRLEKLNEVELSARDMTLDGILCLQAGMSPRLLVERLETYLPPAKRVGHAARAGGPTPIQGAPATEAA
jgi:chemotaxis protein MotA